LHGTTPYVERIDLEGNDMIVSGMVEFAESEAPFGQGHGFRHGVSPAVGRARQVACRGTGCICGDGPQIGTITAAFKRRGTRPARPSAHAAGSRPRRRPPNAARLSPRR